MSGWVLLLLDQEKEGEIGVEKLREEIKKATEPYEKAVGKFILSLNISTIPSGKTLKGCMEAIKGKAKKEW